MKENEKPGIRPMYRSREWNHRKKENYTNLIKNSIGEKLRKTKFNTKVYFLSHPPVMKSWQKERKN